MNLGAYLANLFQDPIHGTIELSDLETTVVNSLEFQRLRFIRQLSLLHYVYPGAFHTRFAHSIGVCGVSWKVSKNLFPRSDKNNYILSVYRLAALLHDVGHGAFSHSLSYLKIKGTSLSFLH